MFELLLTDWDYRPIIKETFETFKDAEKRLSEFFLLDGKKFIIYLVLANGKRLIVKKKW